MNWRVHVTAIALYTSIPENQLGSNKIAFCNSNVNLLRLTPPLLLVLEVKPQMTKQ